MARPREATRITRRAYTVLAALLLADGDWVPARELAAGLFERPIAAFRLGQHVRNLRRFGVAEVESKRNRGSRLVAVPADAHLDAMLACVPAATRSRWWAAWRTARAARTA